jgi:hypothetical protein
LFLSGANFATCSADLGHVHTMVPDKLTAAGRTIEVATPATKTFNSPSN